MANRSFGVFRRRRVAPPHRRLVFALPGASLPEGPSVLSVKSLTFAKATSTGLQTISGVGFRGAAVLIWTTRQTSHAVTDGAQECRGLTDGISQSCRFIHHPDNEASTTSAQAERTNRLVWMTNATSGATPTLQVEGEFAGWTSDGFQIRWHTNDADATLFHVLVLGGVQASLQPVKITVNAGGTIVRTGLGFQPQAFVVLGGAADEFGTGDYSLGAPYGSMHGFGFSNAVDNMSGWTLGRGTAGASDANRGQHTDRVASIRTANLTGAADLCSIQITATSSDGFTVTRTVGSTSHQPIQHILCLRGARFSMGSFNTPVSAGSVALTVPSRPKAVILQAHGATTTEADGMGLGVGVWQEGIEGGTWIGGNDNANPSVYARASYTDAALKLYTPAATGSASTLVVEGTVDSATEGAVVIDFPTVPATPVPVLYLTIGVAATSTGGTVPTGTNPDAGELPTDIPLLFSTLTRQDTSIEGYAQTTLPDAPGYYNDAGLKLPRIDKVSRVRRALSDEDGGYQSHPWSIDYLDGDCLFRGMQATGPLKGAKKDLFLIEDAVRRAEGDAFRVASGVVASHRSGVSNGSPTYSMRVEPRFGNLLANVANQKLVPRKITVDGDSAPGLELQYDETVAPIPYGLLSDDSAAVPQGVVPAKFIGPIDLSAFGGSGVCDMYLVAGVAIKNILSVFYNNPDTPHIRLRVPESAFNSILWCPHKSGWTTKTGMAGQYFDYNGLRYTLILLAQTINYSATFTNNDGTTETRVINIAEYVRNGSVTMTVNLEGVEDAGDGTGDVIDDIDYIWQHFLTNFVFNSATGIGGWLAVPTFGDYSLIDTDSVAAAKAVADALGGIKGAILIGKKNTQISAFEVLRQLCYSGDMNMGENRHGQLMLSREDTAAAAVATFTAQADALEDGLESDIDDDAFLNSAQYRFAERYADATAPVSNTPQGWAAPARLVAPYSEWVSGLVDLPDATSITNVQQEWPAPVDFHAIRDGATAAMLAARKLARARGPSASRDGSRLVRHTTRLQGFEKDGAPIDLGSVIALTHPLGLSATGWTAQKARVLAIEFDPMEMTVTHECRVLAA